MSLLSARVAAAVLAVATFAAALAHKFVLQPLFWRVEPTWLGFALVVLTFALVAAGPPLAYWVLTRPLRRPPASFAIRADGAFTVPQSPVHPGLVAITLMLMAGSQIPAERVPDTDRIRLSTMPWTVPILVTLAAVLAAVAALGLVAARPSVVLTPDGVTIQWPLRTLKVRWPDLLPGGPLPPARRDGTMPLLRREDAPIKVKMGRLHVDRVFLATVIRHYAEHAEHRGDIGTRAELERLVAPVAAGAAPA